MKLKFIALPTAAVRALQSGGADANGQPPEAAVSDGSGNPCRHCLREIPAGEKMLVLAYRPFPAPQPYAETGPIFLCADPCACHLDSDALPEMFLGFERMLIRGYGADDRIVYGTGRVVSTKSIGDAAGEILLDPRVGYVHVRSDSNNCYQCRIERR